MLQYVMCIIIRICKLKFVQMKVPGSQKFNIVCIVVNDNKWFLKNQLFKCKYDFEKYIQDNSNVDPRVYGVQLLHKLQWQNRILKN